MNLLAHCWTILTIPPTPHALQRPRRWIPYTPAQVAAHRLARRVRRAALVSCFVIPAAVVGVSIGAVATIGSPSVAWTPADVATIPEPTTWGLMVVALILLGIVKYRGSRLNAA